MGLAYFCPESRAARAAPRSPHSAAFLAYDWLTVGNEARAASAGHFAVEDGKPVMLRHKVRCHTGAVEIV